MKKILIITGLLIICSALSYGQLTKIGASLSYNSGYWFNLAEHGEKFDDHKTGNPVFGFTGIYEISLPFHIKPSINMFVPNVTKTDFFDGFDKRIVSAFSLDVDAHYVFNYLDRFEFYGLAGLNILYVRMKYISEYAGLDPFKEVSSNNALGLNLGAGSYIKVKEQFDLFVELKYILGKQGQFVATGGILLNIDWLKKNENNEL